MRNEYNKSCNNVKISQDDNTLVTSPWDDIYCHVTKINNKEWEKKTTTEFLMLQQVQKVLNVLN